MTEADTDKGIRPETEQTDSAADATPAPGSPGWVPGRPDKRSDHRTRGPTCPYRLGF